MTSTRPHDPSEEQLSSRNGAGRLDGRVAIVSGGAGGIGQGVAGLFVAEGASVMVCDLPESEGKAVAQSLGPAAGYTALDVRDPRQWRNAVEACTAQFGAEPDILVQTAGIMVFGPVDTGDPEQFRTAFEVNVMGTLNGIQAVAPGMRRGGRGAIVVVTSMAGVTFACKAMGPYAASKAAASSLVRTAALDFAGTGIRVNSIVPGQIDTPMSRAAGVTAEFFEQMPIPRIGQPRDIANAALYLSSDESSWVTGTDLLVDGGMEAGPVLG